MKQIDAQEKLDVAGVDPRSYSMGTLPKDESYVVEQSAGGWAVYYSERGLRTELREFLDEEAALDAFVTAVLSDPTTRINFGLPKPD
ncbi:MAG: hypothetical protein V4479_15570 [Actinomycetota bacterium]